MRVHQLHRELVLPQPRREVFEFFSRPENLAKITPPSMGFEILTPSPIIMRAGTVIDYSVRVMGIRRHWRTLIELYEPPKRFVDIQLVGPYTMWHHEHRFIDNGDSTSIVDTVRYVLPFGFLGQMAHGLVVRPQLEKIFNYRTRVIRELLEEPVS